MKQSMDFIIEFMEKMKFFDEKLLTYRINQYQTYDFDMVSAAEDTEEVELVYAGVVREDIDSLAHILSFAGVTETGIEEVRKKIEAFRNLPDMFSTENEAYTIRRQLTPIFYDVYTRAFLRIVKEKIEPTPTLKMFFNFGFMDSQLAGEEQVKVLYELTNRLELCSSEHVYTIFSWLKEIYEGRKEPSKNEFDVDYTGHLLEMRKNHEITREEENHLKHDQLKKVQFEIHNMFMTNNRITYGRITTFCPVLHEKDFIRTIDQLIVSLMTVNAAIDEIDKSIDHLTKVKNALLGSENNLRLANNKAEDLSIKKLTKNAPSVKAMFDELHDSEEQN